MTAGASDDIRRATELAYRSVSEFGLSAAVGPLAVASMGGDDGSLMLRDSGAVLCCAVHDTLRVLMSVMKGPIKDQIYKPFEWCLRCSRS